MYVVQLAEFGLDLLHPEEGGKKLIRNIGRYFSSNSSSYVLGLASWYMSHLRIPGLWNVMRRH